MVERGGFKIVDVEMQVVNDGDILIVYNIIWYMGLWWKCFWQCFKQPTIKTLYKYGGCSQGNSPSHQPSHMVFIRWKMHQIKYIQYV
jgi:hypothetical protein